MLNVRLVAGFVLGLLCCGWGAENQFYYNTSSATQSLNRLGAASTNGSNNAVLFTASGAVARCTSMAYDGLSGKLFFVDGPSNAVWRVNMDGSGLALVRGNLNAFVADLALDVLNQKIYFTTSSTVQSSNSVQVMDYAGGSPGVLFSASEAVRNGVSRCTAIALDTANSRIFLADAGAGKIWSMNLLGGSLLNLATVASDSFPTCVAIDAANQRVYFTSSSTVQGLNTIQRVNYDGSGRSTNFTASGGVQRCTSLDLDTLNGVIYLSDAGANTVWRVPAAGGSATAVLSGLSATAKKVRYYSGPTSRPAPALTSIKLSGNKVVLNATNGFVGGTYYVLASTNIATPIAEWIPVLTNLLGSSGSFTLVTTNNTAGIAQQFYVLEVE